MAVIGVLEPSGATSATANEDDQAVLPLTTAQRVTGATSTAVSTVYVQTKSADLLPAAYQEIRSLLLDAARRQQ